VCSVDLRDHNVCEIPEELRGFKSQVRELRVNNSQIERLPVWIGELVHFETLEWCGRSSSGRLLRNCTWATSDGFWLSARGRYLLPTSFGELASLHMLKLANLPVDQPRLPSSFSKLTGKHRAYFLIRCDKMKK
jgi:Leucine-rich repeat (LRR) protein